MVNVRKARILEISVDLLPEMLKQWNGTKTSTSVVESGLPTDVAVIAVSVDNTRRIIQFTLWSDKFDMVAEGEMIPILPAPVLQSEMIPILPQP